MDKTCTVFSRQQRNWRQHKEKTRIQVVGKTWAMFSHQQWKSLHKKTTHTRLVNKTCHVLTPATEKLTQKNCTVTYECSWWIKHEPCFNTNNDKFHMYYKSTNTCNVVDDSINEWQIYYNCSNVREFVIGMTLTKAHRNWKWKISSYSIQKLQQLCLKFQAL
jgi:hypothetical protein